MSVLIPAHNAARTLAVTLASLAEQTLDDWEAVVVDDGSSDGTATIAEMAAAADHRIRVVRRSHGGVSAARNTAIEHARGELIAFLDADDWLAPHALERLTGALRARPRLDAVHCGWIRVAADGREAREICSCRDGNLLSLHQRTCGFAVHAAVVRRALIQRTGGFDPSLVTCEDWDFWVRLSRMGARWGRVAEHLVYYRMRPESASSDAAALLRDGLVVVDRAHRADPGLTDGRTTHAADDEADQRGRARLDHVIHTAALALGQGEDGLALLAALPGQRCRHLAPEEVAYALYAGVALGAATVPEDWSIFAPELVDRVACLLEALEVLTGAPALALRARRALQRLVADTSSDRSLFAEAATLGPDLERPLQDIAVAPATNRLFVRARFGTLEVPTIELPVCDGSVGAAAIADAIADEHAWALLGEFLRVTVYPERDLLRALHDHAGWLVFLQEAWGDRAACNASFYDAAKDGDLKAVDRLAVSDGWAVFELSGPPAHIATRTRVHVCATVGGAAVAGWTAAPSRGLIRAGTLRRELCVRAGFELCRIAVRQALLGRPIAGGASLRDRLIGAAARAGSAAAQPLRAPEGFELAPGWEERARTALGTRAGHVIARRRHATVGSSASRPAVFGRLAGGVVVAAARAAGDPVVVVGRPGAAAPVVYAPDLVWHDDAVTDAGGGLVGRPSRDEPQGRRRPYFEALFAAGEDPWEYTTEYERTKYEQTLSLVPGPRPARALELACAEGHFTALLAPRVGELVACDISKVALRRARARCLEHPNVSFAFHDLFADPIEGRYDLVVCSEVLYYAGDRHRLKRASAAIARALAPDGVLLSAHANLVVDDPAQPGFDWPLPFGGQVIGEAFAAAGLELQLELGNPLYRVQSYRRRRRRHRARADRRAAPLPQALPAPVAEHFLWEGGRPAADDRGEVVSRRLPILMYHRVAPSGADALRRWRVTPAEFEEQLHYLRTSGHRSATFAEWRAAVERRRPLPGRRVLLTFDDGYEDFAEHAWPLLRQYEFDATVFLVSDLVGGTNEWDGHVGETAPLMDWATIRALADEGVRFGGHSVSHPRLTALGLEHAVEQVASCRATLLRELGHPVTAFAYPYGDTDPALARMVGACGFEYAVTTDGYRASPAQSMLLLPRVEVAGSDSFETFVTTITPLP